MISLEMIPNDLVHVTKEGNVHFLNELENDHLYNLITYYIRRLKNQDEMTGITKVKLATLMLHVIHEKLELTSEDIIKTKQEFNKLMCQQGEDQAEYFQSFEAN